MSSLTLQAKIREERGKRNSKLRRQYELPAIVYGHGVKPMPLTLNAVDFKKIFAQAGESSLVDLVIDGGQPAKVLIAEVQHDPKTSQIIHADFHQVKMTEEITTEVALKWIGESPAVKGLSGVLVKNLDKIKITCLPADLIHEIEVDLSLLKTFEDVIHVSELKIPEKIKVLEKLEEVVAKVIPPRSEEELKELEEKPEEKIEEVEKVEKEKKETEEEEGEEKTPASAKGVGDKKGDKKGEKK